VDAVAVRDRLRHLFGLLGVRSQVQVVTFGMNKAIAFSPLRDTDADKLAEALDKVPELRPYVAHRAPAATGEATPR
jgi:hypothetical protein